jgi:hypothetical protein
MERGSAFGLVCSCGSTFPSHGPLQNHQKACKKIKKRLSIALAKVNEALNRTSTLEACAGLEQVNSESQTDLSQDQESAVVDARHDEIAEVGTRRNQVAEVSPYAVLWYVP